MFILKAVVRWFILSAAVILATYLIPGITVNGWVTVLVVGLVLGLINTFVKPVLEIITLPINLITFGLFAIVLNAALFWATGYLVTGFVIASWTAALLGSLLVSVIMWIEHFVF